MLDLSNGLLQYFEDAIRFGTVIHLILLAHYQIGIRLNQIAVRC